MIVKKVTYKQSKPKPKAWQISDLTDYIRSPRDVNPLEKIEHSGSRGFLAETHAGQKMEMIALANASVRSPMPVNHWIFSWQEGEQPSPEQVEEAVDIFMERMGLSGHQVIYGLHYNTENYHLHIAVNRVNPETEKTVRPNNGFDKELAHKIVAEIEYEQGWSREENGRYRMDASGGTVRALRPEREPKPRPEALDFEAETGEKSAQRIAQERGYEILKNALSWSELHTKLAAADLRFAKKGSGAILFVGEIAVKASSVDRAFSMGNLCKRLGEFAPGEYGEMAPVTPEPVSLAHAEDWKEYRAGRVQTPSEKPDLPPPDATAKLKTQHKLERQRLARRMAGNRLAVINDARHELAVKQRKERLALAPPRPVGNRRRQRFKTWLKAQGRVSQAENWRYRNRHFTAALPPPVTQSGEALAAYAAHRETLQKQNARRTALAAGMALFGKISDDPPESLSRQDAKIALLLRLEGYSREAVVNAIRQGVSEARNGETRDWRRYAVRTAAYAFGVAGDMELARMGQNPVQASRLPDCHEDTAQPESPRLRMK